MDRPKVSVIIPVYNTARYLSQCLDSILAQTLTDIEVICVDDGSTDDSPGILRTYAQKDKRLRVITQENTSAGAAAARNVGLVAANGEFVSFLDSDDFFDLTMLEEMNGRAKESGVCVVLCDGNYYDDKLGVTTVPGAILHTQFVPEKTVFSYRDCPGHIFQLCIGSAWNLLLRRDFVLENDLRFQAVHHADDLLFASMALIKAKVLTVIEKRFVYYRINIESSQREKKSAWPDGAYVACHALKKALCEAGAYDEVRQSFVNKCLNYLVWYLDTMKSWEGFRFLWHNMRDKYFADLDIIGHDKDYFYSSHTYEWIDRIMDEEPEQWLYERYCSLRHMGIGGHFLFPESHIPRGAKIVLYGAGDVGKTYFHQLIDSHYCQVVLWVDRKWEELGAPVADPSIILDADYDVVLIAIENKDIAKAIREYLLKLGVQEEHIVYPISSERKGVKGARHCGLNLRSRKERT